MKKRKTLLLITDLVAIVLLTYFDQFTKGMAVLYLKGKPDIPILRNVLVLQYLENKGAAFGMLQNQKIFFIFIEILILFVIGFVLLRVPSHRKYNLMHLILVLIASGAIGNMIDRAVQDYVVDFIYFDAENSADARYAKKETVPVCRRTICRKSIPCWWKQICLSLLPPSIIMAFQGS